jgi:hypothetical protein
MSGVRSLLVLLHIARVLVVAFLVIAPLGLFTTTIKVEVPQTTTTRQVSGEDTGVTINIPGATVTGQETVIEPAHQVAIEVSNSDDRLVLWLGHLPLLAVVLVSLTLIIGVTRATLAGNPFGPETARRLRTLAWTVGLGGTVASIVGEQVRYAVARRLMSGTSIFRISLPLNWIIAGLFAALVAAIVTEGVRRSTPQPYPVGP